MALPAYIRFTHRGTPLPASIMTAGRENTSEVHTLTHFVGFVGTNFYSGKVTRKHTPFILQIPLGNVTPRLYESLCKGLKIDQVEIIWCQHSEKQKDKRSLQTYFTHILEKAKISRVELFFNNIKDPAFENYGHLMTIEICYEYVTWLHTEGNLLFRDKWDYVYAYQQPRHRSLTPEQMQDLLDTPSPLTDSLAEEITAYKTKKQQALASVKSNVLDQLAQITIVNEKGNPATGISFNDTDKNKVADSKLNIISVKDIEGQQVHFNWNDITMNFTTDTDIRVA